VALNGRKVSGNAQRRSTLLHHGTFLYRFDSRLMQRYIREPERRPAYRGGRNHAAFVTDLPHNAEEIKRALVSIVSNRFGSDVFPVTSRTLW
jgi:lipoate-protein ligase A